MVARGLLLVLIGSLAMRVATGQEAPTYTATQRFGAATTAVVVDVVVRDRRGGPVTDLRKEDFELFEDGVRQEIGDVQLVAPPTGAGAAEAARRVAAEPPGSDGAAGAPTAVTTPAFVALVFDRLSPEARALAHEGAQAYLETAGDDQFAGVFVSDLSLVTIQTFTSDRRLVRAGLDQAAWRATAVFDRQTYRINTGLGDPHPATPPTASAEHQGPPDPRTKELLRQAGLDYRGPNAELALAAMARRMERAYETLMQDAQGHATTNALLALIDGLGMLPGRKTIVFFAEGLAIPPAVQARFQAVIAAANRHNVSVYTVDAAGLRVHSKAAEAGRQIRELGAGGVGDVPRGSSIGLKDLELNEDILRQDPAASLAILAERTGGFLINNTNDLARGFRDIDADRRFHYLLTYTPKNEQFNGEWRTVTVRVPGRRVDVRARSGYQALRTASVIPVLAWEVSALSALEMATPPRDIPIRLGAFTFPANNGESMVPIAVALDADRVAFDVTPQGFRTDFTILTRVVDSAGEVVRKGSQPYRLAGPPERLEATRAGEVLFYRQPTLPPGDYTVEVAVVDAFARRGTVERRPFTVPATEGDAVRVSSLMVVKGAEQVPPEEQDEDHPLHVGEHLVYPNLGEPIPQGNAITAFATIVPGAGPAPRAQFEVIAQGGTSLTTRAVTLDAQDARGRIRQLVQIPTESLAPGEYVLRLSLEQGTRREVREAVVAVRERDVEPAVQGR